MKGILFDLDNTLTNRTATIHRYAKVFLETFRDRLHPGVTPERLGRIFCESDGGGYQGHETRSQMLSGHSMWMAPVEAELLTTHWKDWIPNNPVPMAGTYELLDWLAARSFKLGMITNGSSLAQRTKIKVLGLEKRFDAIVISEEAGVKKPNPRIFDLAARELGTVARDCVFIGDDPTNDYFGGSEAGMTPIWLEGFRPWNYPEEAKIRISALADVPEIIERLVDGRG